MATTGTASSANPITIINRFIAQPPTASAANPAKPQLLEKFYKGEPLALGITQILVGAVQLAVGVVMAMVSTFSWILALSVHVPIWTGLLYIISGGLSVAAAKNPKIQLVKGSLGMNIISSVLAGCAVILYLLSLTDSMHRSICYSYPETCLTYSVVIYQNMVLPDDPTTATKTHSDAVACTPPPSKDLTTP
ncbi:membrane-spanning 4-domains subfamily A member 4A-like isoform 3-T4 [Pangshura tecta]